MKGNNRMKSGFFRTSKSMLKIETICAMMVASQFDKMGYIPYNSGGNNADYQ